MIILDFQGEHQTQALIAWQRRGQRLQIWELKFGLIQIGVDHAQGYGLHRLESIG